MNRGPSWCGTDWRNEHVLTRNWLLCTVLFASISTSSRSVALHPFCRLQRMLCPRLHRGEKSSSKKSIKTPLFVFVFVFWYICEKIYLYKLHAFLFTCCTFTKIFMETNTFPELDIYDSFPVVLTSRTQSDSWGISSTHHSQGWPEELLQLSRSSIEDLTEAAYMWDSED